MNKKISDQPVTDKLIQEICRIVLKHTYKELGGIELQGVIKLKDLLRDFETKRRKRAVAWARKQIAKSIKTGMCSCGPSIIHTPTRMNYCPFHSAQVELIDDAFGNEVVKDD